MAAVKTFLKENYHWLVFVMAVVAITFLFEAIHPQPMMSVIDTYFANISHIPRISLLLKGLGTSAFVLGAHGLIILK